MERRENIDWIAKTKGFAILGIVAVHTVQQFDVHNGITRMADAGRYCVQLFFIISAFLIFRSLASRSVESWTIKDYLKFLFYKITRLIPVLYLAILWNLIMYFLSIGEIPSIADEVWKKALFPALFINGFSYEYFNPWMTWYIGVLVIFYAIAPLLFRFIDSAKKSIIFFVLAAFFGWLLNYILVSFCGVMSDDWFFYGWLPRQLPVFALGIILYHLYKAPSLHDIRYSIATFAFVAAVGFLLSMCAFTSPLELHVRYGILLLLFSITLFSHLKIKLGWLNHLGNCSYGIYLFHGCIISVLNLLMNAFGIFRNATWVFFIYYILMVVLSFFVAKIVNILIEKPFFSMMNRKLGV